MASASCSWSVVCDQAVLPAVLARAKKIVDYMQEQKLESHFVTLEDGTTITAQIIAGQPRVIIAPPPVAPKLPTAPPANLWVPRGFVTYPAFAGARGGVGMPIIQDMSGDAYAPINTAPGLDISRWTAGGPCGEVLLSADKDAGYDDNLLNVPAPALYHPIKGPTFQWSGKGSYDDRPLTAEWTAYRMELSAPIARYSDESAAQAKSMFEAVNSYRVSNSATALSLPPRGYSGAAEVMVSIMQAAGTTDATSPSYPDTYKTTDDRLTKDGFTADVLKVSFTTFNRGDHPVAYELRALGGSVGSTMAVWEADTDDNAILLKDVGEAAFTDVGYRGGYWAANIVRRDRWLQAGNVAWQADDTGLPPISWHGFASDNLAWETYPAIYDDGAYATAPLIPVRSFTNGQGDCWLNYPRKNDTSAAYSEPALGRHVYARGRAIAMAPRGGLVWGACITAVGNVDRLIALVHHPEEQPSDYTHEGFTRYLRVWWVDVPRRASLRLAPPMLICGEAADDDWAWKGGDQVDLGAMPAPSAGFVASAGTVNSLKYASSWRFAKNGLSAVCLRDYGVFTDYALLHTTAKNGWSAAINARAVELVFSTSTTAVSTSVVYHGYTAGATSADRSIPDRRPPDVNETYDVDLYEIGAQPISVDYDGNTLVYAYAADVVSYASVFYTPGPGEVGFGGNIVVRYLGTGNAAVKYATDLRGRVLQGARFKTAAVNRAFEVALVINTSAGIFAAKISRPRFAVNPSSTADGLTKVSLPCQNFTGAGVDGVQFSRAGAYIAEDWYGAPDGVLWSINDLCFLTSGAPSVINLPQAVSANIQGFFASRFGEAIFGYNASPMPAAVMVLAAPPSSTACGCFISASDIASTHWMTYDELSPRGGRYSSSVSNPPADWLIYAKVI